MPCSRSLDEESYLRPWTATWWLPVGRQQVVNSLMFSRENVQLIITRKLGCAFIFESHNSLLARVSLVRYLGFPIEHGQPAG